MPPPNPPFPPTAAGPRPCRARPPGHAPGDGPPRPPPSPPVEAELIAELPEPDGWQYEPKWDGFRGILENVTGELHLWSRNGRPLLRYFPALEAPAQKPPRAPPAAGGTVL